MVEDTVRRRVGGSTRASGSSLYALLHAADSAAPPSVPSLTLVGTWLQDIGAKTQLQMTTGTEIIWDSASSIVSLLDTLCGLLPFPVDTPQTSIAAEMVALMRVGGGIRTDTLFDRPRADTTKIASTTISAGFGTDMANAILAEFRQMCRQCIAVKTSALDIDLTNKAATSALDITITNEAATSTSKLELNISPVSTLWREMFAGVPNINTKVESFLISGPAQENTSDWFQPDIIEYPIRTPYILTAAPDAPCSADRLWLCSPDTIGINETLWTDAILAVTRAMAGQIATPEKIATPITSMTGKKQKSTPSGLKNTAVYNVAASSGDLFATYNWPKIRIGEGVGVSNRLMPYKFMRTAVRCNDCDMCRSTDDPSAPCIRRWAPGNDALTGFDTDDENISMLGTNQFQRLFTAALAVAQAENVKNAATRQILADEAFSTDHEHEDIKHVALMSAKIVLEHAYSPPALHYADEQFRTTKVALWHGVAHEHIDGICKSAETPTGLFRHCMELLDPVTVTVTGPLSCHVETLCAVQGYYHRGSRFVAALAAAKRLMSGRRGWTTVSALVESALLTKNQENAPEFEIALACLLHACDDVQMRTAPKHLTGGLSAVQMRSLHEARESALVGVFLAAQPS
jgi:hypothetical protein